MKNTAQFIFIPIMLFGLLCLTGCEKKKEPESESNTVTDYDGNVYPTVKIFTQTWMAENLKTSRLNDGKMITLVPDSWNWDFLDEPKRCYYNNYGNAYRDVYGQLYNQYAVRSGKLCPVGWHVPTLSDWGTLIGYLGTESTAGGKLKESGTEHWLSPNSGADNSSGFTALPGGMRTSDGTFTGIGSLGIWWIDNNTAGALNLEVFYNKSYTFFQGYTKYYGLSVRCIKDNR